MAEREDLSRVGERYWTFARRVERSEQVDEEGDQAQMRRVVSRDVEAESGCQKSPRHVREGEQ
jgi:hypothetical protein